MHELKLDNCAAVLAAGIVVGAGNQGSLVQFLSPFRKQDRKLLAWSPLSPTLLQLLPESSDSVPL